MLMKNITKGDMEWKINENPHTFEHGQNISSQDSLKLKYAFCQAIRCHKSGIVLLIEWYPII